MRFLSNPSRAFPITLNSNVLAAEVHNLPTTAWQKVGAEELGAQSILPLVSAGGSTSHHDFAWVGEMRPTTYLAQSPHLNTVLSQLNFCLSRCYLLRFMGQTQTTQQCYYHWFRYRTLWIPIHNCAQLQIKNQAETLDFQPATAWQISLLKHLEILNASAEAALVLCVESQFQPLVRSEADKLPLEPYQFNVLTPGEFKQLTALILTGLTDKNTQIAQSLQQLQSRWQHAFEQFSHQLQGELAYQTILTDFTEQVLTPLRRARLNSEIQCYAEIIQSQLEQTAHKVTQKIKQHWLVRQRQKQNLPATVEHTAQFDRPLFIVSAPRAGSSLLFETLAKIAEVWTVAEESHEIIEGIPALHPAAQAYHSNCLSAKEATVGNIKQLSQRFTRQLQNRQEQRYLDLNPTQRPSTVRFLEKTPKNVLRVPFLATAFPDALFLYLYREPKQNVSSLIEGWRSQRFIAYRNLPNWPHKTWSFLLPPDWQTYKNASIPEISAYQWYMANQIVMRDLQTLPKARYLMVNYADFIAHPQQTIEEISQFAGLQRIPQWETQVDNLPASRMTLSAPSPDKWKRYATVLLPLMSKLEPIWTILERKKLC